MLNGEKKYFLHFKPHQSLSPDSSICIFSRLPMLYHPVLLPDPGEYPTASWSPHTSRSFAVLTQIPPPPITLGHSMSGKYDLSRALSCASPWSQVLCNAHPSHHRHQRDPVRQSYFQKVFFSLSHSSLTHPHFRAISATAAATTWATPRSRGSGRIFSGVGSFTYRAIA